MVGSPGLIVFGVWATVFGLRVCFDFVEDEPAVDAIPDCEVVCSVFPGVAPVLVALRYWGVAGVAGDPPPGVGEGHLTFEG